MVDIERFITALYVLASDCLRKKPLSIRRGPTGKLTNSEAITLLIFSQWSRFRSEKHFYRFAEKQLIHLFPNLPCR